MNIAKKSFNSGLTVMGAPCAYPSSPHVVPQLFLITLRTTAQHIIQDVRDA